MGKHGMFFFENIFYLVEVIFTANIFVTIQV